MKRLTLLFLLIYFNLSFGQYLSNHSSENHNHYTVPSSPDMGVDEDGEGGGDGDDDEPPPGGEEAPIDDYLIYLTILGVLIGVMVHNSKAKMRV
jgi:hypothetical protein